MQSLIESIEGLSKKIGGACQTFILCWDLVVKLCKIMSLEK